MLDKKHKIDGDIDNTYDLKCSKCKMFWLDLYTISLDIERRINLKEKNLDYVDRVNPCLTDEEAMIKDLLE